MTADPPPAPPEALDVATAAQLACLLEASAPKPGNVSPGRHFRDTRYEDFLASAAAVGPAFAAAGTRGVGATVLAAVGEAARWTRSNTNLGIVLLLAPLARAALTTAPAADARWPADALRAGVRRVLAATTVADARDVYTAIRLAAPGGLGEAPAEDVGAEPTVTLTAAMALAAARDGVAAEYAGDYVATFEVGAPALARARADGLAWDDAVVETFLALLAHAPDTHIARRGGDAAAVSRQAARVLAAGGPRSAGGRAALAEFDAALRDARNVQNPGTTADLTAATIFVVLLGGGWHSTLRGIDAGTR